MNGRGVIVGVDVGGTFTDVVAVRDGKISVTKVPSSRSNPPAPVVEGAKRLGVAGSTVFNHASTMGLNAVIEQRLDLGSVVLPLPPDNPYALRS